MAVHAARLLMQTAAIAETRMPARLVQTVVTVVDKDGRPRPNTDVVVEQTSHAFHFGNIAFDFLDLANGGGTADDQRLADLWLELFNTATLPFYWSRFEPIRGLPDTIRLKAAAQWLVDRGVAVKGHPLAWHTLAPRWLRALTIDEIADAQRARIRREVTDFAGLIDTWDAINEVVIMPVFQAEDNGLTRLARARGRIPTIRLAFEEARAANPHATLLLNDFDLSSAYECLIEGVLEAGIRIDAIGLQTHMHQGYWGADAMLAMVERFARYGLPLHLTENSLVSGDLMPADIVDLNDYQPTSWLSTADGEARQATEIEQHYRSLVAHPAVESITYWGITDRGAWLGAPTGLVRADGTVKPSYEALRSLIKGAWWLPPTTVRTDGEGRFALSGFRGEYSVDGVAFHPGGEGVRTVMPDSFRQCSPER